MNEEIKMVMDELKAASDKSLQHVAQEISKLRAGKASPSMLSSVMVEYYGSKVPLSQVANVNTLDAKTIIVKPWEKALIDEISRGIMYANLGLNPQNDGEQVLINVPPLTEERRLQLVKQAKAKIEEAKVVLNDVFNESRHMTKSNQRLFRTTIQEVENLLDTL